MADPPASPEPPGRPDAEALLAAGLERHQAGDRDAAEGLFRQALAAQPGEPTALYLLGLTRFEAGDADEARALLEAVTAARPRHVQARLTLANLHHWNGDFAVAADSYRQVLALDPGQGEALVGLSQALLAAGDQAGALEAAREATAVAPEDAAAQLALAAVLTALGEARQAAAAYGEAAELAPQSAAAHVGLALALLQTDDIEGARASAERALALDQGSAAAWFALGSARRAAGEPGPAAEALERSIELDPERAAGHLNLGLAYIELDQPPLAEHHLLIAAHLDPQNKEAHANLSSLYIRADQLDEARAHAQRALELDPTMIIAHQNLAGVLTREGRDEEARHHRDRAYRGHSLFVVTAARPVQRVLVLTTTESGNTPERYLLPTSRYTRLNWFIEYAREGQLMSDLPPYDVVFNAIGDQDLAGPTARNAARFMQVCTQPVFNRPDRIERTRRHMTPALLADIAGVVTPKTARIEAATLAARGLIGAAGDAGIDPPMLVRPIGSHGGKGLERIDAEMAAAGDVPPPAPGRDHYVTAFHDFRSADGLYRKFRSIFVDRKPYPYHLAIGPDWMVHYETSGTAEHADRLAEERRFLEDPAGLLGAGAMDAIAAIGERLDLDFCGIDFGLLEDGRVLVFEANATMLVHPEDPDGPLAHKNPHVTRILEAFWAMLAGA